MKKAISKKNVWDSMPAIIKKILGYALGKIPPEHLIGSTYKETSRFLNTSQWWSKEEIEQYQLAQLKHLLTTAYEKSPYYKKLFDDSGFSPYKFARLHDIKAIPFLDKHLVNQNRQQMLTVSPNSPRVDYVTTGGTSGMPLSFYTSANRSQPEFAYLTSGWGRVGYQLGSQMAVLRGQKVKQDRNGLHHEYDPILRHNYYSNFHLSDENIEKYLDHIKTLGTCFLHVYPSSVYYLAKFIKRSGYVAPENIRGILAESENVYPDQRAFIEEVFKCRYFSSYGHTEKLVAAAECEYSTNYHVWPTYGYFELIDENGEAIREKGKAGEIVGTGFLNDVMPFIRYRTGDYAEYVGEHCELCGRNHTVISNIRGHRVQEVLVAADGSHIPWTAVNAHDDTFDDVLKFQFEQHEKGHAILKIVTTGNFSDKNLDRIRRNLSAKFDHRLTFEIKSVDDIKLTNAGKSIYVDQRIKLAH